MLAGRASRQQQNRYVAAANRQQQAHRAKQQIESFADAVRNPVAEILNREFLVFLWKVVRRLFGKFLEVSLQLRRGGLRFHLGFELDERTVLFARSARHFQGEIDIRAQKSEVRRHHADHGVGFVHQLNRLAHNRRVTVIVAHPELVVQDHHRPRILAVGRVRRQKVPAQHRGNTKHLKHVAGERITLDIFGHVASGYRQRPAVEGHDVFE